MARTPAGMVRGAAWLALGVLAAAGSARAQDEESTKSTVTKQLEKVLTDPAEMEKLKKEEQRDAFEFFKTTVLPNDVIPYVKANHWSTLALELRANRFSYDGWLETDPPVPLLDMPHEVVFRRDARLVKGQRSRILFQVMTPTIPRELPLQLIRPESLRYDDRHTAALRPLLPHQMLVPILTKGPNEGYGRWSHLRSHVPALGDEERPGRLRQSALLPNHPHDRARPLLPADPPADLDDDQPRHLGRHAARHAEREPAGRDEGLAALGRAIDHRRRGRAEPRPVPRELPGPVPARGHLGGRQAALGR